MADLNHYNDDYEFAVGESIVDKLNNPAVYISHNAHDALEHHEPYKIWHIEAEPQITPLLRHRPDLLVTNGEEAIVVEFKNGNRKQSAHFASLVQVHEASESIQDQMSIRKVNAAFITNQEIDPGVKQVAQSLNVDMFRADVNKLSDLNYEPRQVETLATGIVTNYLKRRKLMQIEPIDTSDSDDRLGQSSSIPMIWDDDGNNLR